MSLNIIGISAHYHDSACCLLRDGKLVAAAQEERFSRIKNDPATPRQAFRYCLQRAGLSIGDIDCIAYYEDPLKKLQRQLWMGMIPKRSAERQARLLQRLSAEPALVELRATLGFDGPIETFDHHESHAASSYYYSGFNEAAVLTVDGVGEWATTTFARGDGHSLQMLGEVHFPHSLGLFYSAITAYLGFEVNEGEYKVMGLAPYGQPRYLPELRQLLTMQDDGRFRLDMRYFDFLHSERMFSDSLVTLLGQPPRERESPLSEFHHDVARSAQVLLEECMLTLVRHLHSIAPSENLCLAGGVALNCVANAKILREGPFKHLFVQPAAGDAGTALGAAALAHTRRTGARPSSERLRHVYLGPSYTSAAIENALDASALEYLSYHGREADLVSAVAERLASGKVIGWFQGSMEFGPRALGARSILADPRVSDMRDRINALVKQRESFRPFAPVVLADRASRHFEIDHASPFMLETCAVVPGSPLPAITHVDGSARLQTVDADTNPRLAALLEAFEARTGCAVLLNTSFNTRGEPIVCTPEDALLCFVRARLDCLVLEDVLIDSERVPEFWPLIAMQMYGAVSGISRDVYTML